MMGQSTASLDNSKRTTGLTESHPMDASEDDNTFPVTILEYLIQELQQGPPPMDAVQEGDKAVRSRIVKLKDQISLLTKMQQALVKYVESAVETIQNRKESEINALFDTFSPFLSLGHNNLSKALDFLDPEALLNAEFSSYTLCQVIQQAGRWANLEMVNVYTPQKTGFFKASADDSNLERYMEELNESVLGVSYEEWRPRMQVPSRYQLRPRRCAFLQDAESQSHQPNDTPAGRYHQQNDAPAGRLRFLGSLMERARLWEDAGESVYDYNYANFDMSINDITVHANACRRDSEPLAICNWVSHDDDHYPGGSDIVFLRFSERFDGTRTTSVKNSRVMWQGFAKMTNDEERRDIHIRKSHVEDMNWSGLDHYYEWLSRATRAEKARDGEERIKPLLQNLRLSMIMLTCGHGPSLIVASGGYYKSEVSSDNEVVGHLHPRCCEYADIATQISLKFVSEEDGIKIRIIMTEI
jgi:hypothetical protein